MKKCKNCSIITDVVELRPGDVVPVWMRGDDGIERLEFMGQLVRYLSANNDPYPFFLKCIGSKPRKGCRRQVNAVVEKWIVTNTEDTLFPNATYVRNIRKFHSYGPFTINMYMDSEDAILLNGYCIDFLENDTFLCSQLKRELTGKIPGTELLKNFTNYKHDIRHQRKS